jgi:hypothetical protein
MSILVVCHGCKKSFQVSEKFAGKTGPCPKCKATIKIPEKAEEVKVHGGEDFATGGRTTSGQLALKPIARKKVKADAKTIGIIAGATVGVIVLALVFRIVPIDHYVVGTLGLLLLSPLLTLAAYTFLYDDESEPYRGRVLYIRVAACAAVYALLWAVFVYVRGSVAEEGTIDLPYWIVIVPSFVLPGAAAAYLSLDLEPSNAFFHYAFYLVITSLLAAIAGMGWAWS